MLRLELQLWHWELRYWARYYFSVGIDVVDFSLVSVTVVVITRICWLPVRFRVGMLRVPPLPFL